MVCNVIGDVVVTLRGPNNIYPIKTIPACVVSCDVVVARILQADAALAVVVRNIVKDPVVGGFVQRDAIAIILITGITRY